VHLLKLAAPPEPKWEPDQGWRVIDADGHVVNAGPRTLLVAEFNLAGMFGLDETQVPEVGTGQER
jgi:glutamate formiminotransferase